jgi:hypothetical protein
MAVTDARRGGESGQLGRGGDTRVRPGLAVGRGQLGVEDCGPGDWNSLRPW